MPLISIGVVAEMFGVTTQTIRNWCKEGFFKKVELTKGKHRRFDLDEINDIRGIEKEQGITAIYARVSSFEQKNDLKRQAQEIEQFCHTSGIAQTEVIEDIGSGMNCKKKGLIRLVTGLILGKFKRLVISFKDRLLRFGSEIIFQICKLLNVEVIILRDQDEKTFEQQLVDDVMAILTVYASKIYGRRSHDKKRQSLRA